MSGPDTRPSQGDFQMKPFASKRSSYSPCVLMVALFISAPAWAQEPSVQASPVPETPASAAVQFTPSDTRYGTLKSVQGEVTLVRGDTRRTAKPGDGFLHTHKLVVGAKSAAALTLQDGTTLAVGPDSEVDLEKFSYDPTTQHGSITVRLARGSLRMVTGLIAKLKPEEVSVRTPTAVIGVRGTDFIVEAEAP